MTFSYKFIKLFNEEDLKILGEEFVNFYNEMMKATKEIYDQLAENINNDLLHYTSEEVMRKFNEAINNSVLITNYLSEENDSSFKVEYFEDSKELINKVNGVGFMVVKFNFK